MAVQHSLTSLTHQTGNRIDVVHSTKASSGVIGGVVYGLLNSGLGQGLQISWPNHNMPQISLPTTTIKLALSGQWYCIFSPSHNSSVVIVSGPLSYLKRVSLGWRKVSCWDFNLLTEPSAAVLGLHISGIKSEVVQNVRRSSCTLIHPLWHTHLYSCNKNKLYVLFSKYYHWQILPLSRHE